MLTPRFGRVVSPKRPQEHGHFLAKCAGPLGELTLPSWWLPNLGRFSETTAGVWPFFAKRAGPLGEPTLPSWWIPNLGRFSETTGLIVRRRNAIRKQEVLSIPTFHGKKQLENQQLNPAKFGRVSFRS